MSDPPKPNMEVIPAPPRSEVIPAPRGGELYPLLTDPGDVLALFDERLRTGGLPVLDLPRIRVPGGGSVAFRYDTAAGEETAKKLEGIITAWRPSRLYWKSRAAGKKPPDCTSINGFSGVGDPGGVCADCPHARFGTSVKPDGGAGAGQACKDVRQALFLMEGELLPHLLNIPPTSVKAFGQYTLTLMSARAHYWGAITEITLEKAQSDDKIDYAKIVFRLKTRLSDPSQFNVLKGFHERMRSVLEPAIVDASAYEIEEDRPRAAPRPLTPNGPPATPDPNDDNIPF